MNKKIFTKYAPAAALMMFMAVRAYAADGQGGGEEFNDVWELLAGWSQGVLGRIIALGAVIVGIGFGLVRQSVIAAAVGIAMALVLQFAPTVIENIIGATADGTSVAVIAQVDNGLNGAPVNLDAPVLQVK